MVDNPHKNFGHQPVRMTNIGNWLMQNQEFAHRVLEAVKQENLDFDNGKTVEVELNGCILRVGLATKMGDELLSEVKK